MAMTGVEPRSSLGRFRLQPLVRAAKAALVLAAASCLAMPAAQAAAVNEGTLKVEVQSPYFGDVLYRVYQQQYFSALTSLMASQERNRLKPNEADAELLKGGMLLNNGLHREAGQLFEHLTDRGVDAATRRKAWLQLAKSRYERGLPEEAAAALNRIDGPLLPSNLEDQRTLLQAQVQLGLGQYGAAADALRQLAGREANAKADVPLDPEALQASRYARFNLGVALVRNGDATGGMQTLDALGQAPASNEEMRALKDSANVALGFAALQANRPEEAKTWLERVRLNGAMSNKALLGFGWADLALKNPTAALVPWEELTSRNPSDTAVLEGRLAFPYALAQAGQTQNALAQYEEALKQFDLEARRLNESIATLKAPEWLEEAQKLQVGEEMGWNAQSPKVSGLAHAAHLDAVFAQNSFQQALKDQRDLQFMFGNLTEWQNKLDSQLEATRYRAQVLGPKLAQLKAEAVRLKQTDVLQRIGQLESLQVAEFKRANADEQRLLQAKERVQRSLSEVAALRSSRLQLMHDLAVNVLTEQQQRLAGYITQARFGLAQMYDRALKDNSNQEGSRATSR